MGRRTGYYIVIDGDKIKYFNSDKQIVDSAFIRLTLLTTRNLDQ